MMSSDQPASPAGIASVAVFCGSRHGNHPAYRAASIALGTGLARAGMRLVYGGGRIGLMGVVADAVLQAGGTALGVIPEFLCRREVMHDGVMDLVITDSMHSRKQTMFEAADAFVMLPGGLGTLDELVEIITWRQLGLHDKPVLLCDVAGSAQPILAAFRATIEMGFANADAIDLFEVIDGAEATLARLAALHASPAPTEPARL